MAEKIYNDITEAIGGTPLVRLNAVNETEANVYAKLEFNNPTASVKDRLALGVVRAAERSGDLAEGGTIVEGTSGNTGIALAAIGAARGYRVIIAMPETMSLERRAIMRAFGAELVLTPGPEGMRGAVAKAEEIQASTPGAILARQFANEANVEIHRETTAKEIWEDTDGGVDIVVAGIGTGGTITGAGRYLQEQKSEVKAVAVEPADSPILSGGNPGPHKIQGIGANFVPEVLDTEVYSEVYTATLEESVAAARDLGVKEGILGGISTGAIIAAALDQASREENRDKLIVAIVPDFGERYISTVLYEDIRG